MSDHQKVIIIGGGVIGAWSAYFLRKAGHEVTILDKKEFASGCSEANCGYICPSHALPLCVPSALMKPIKSMFNSYSPFYVNPMVGPSLWGWLLRFTMSCTKEKSMASAKARHQLLQSSMELIKETLQREKMEVEFKEQGLLFVHTEEKSLQHYAKVNELLTREFSLPATFYDSKGVVELEPSLKDSVAGGWHYEGDAHLRPDKLMSELRRVLTSMGVSILEHQEVIKFSSELGRIKGVVTQDGEHECGNLLLATGALAPLLAKKLEVKLHIQPGKGYSITTNRPDPCPKIPMILEDHSVAVTPFDEGFRLGSTMEFGGYNEDIDRKRLGLLEEGAKHYLRDVKGTVVQQEWYGLRPMSHNGIPIISKVPKYPNAWIAAGHSMLGVSMGTGTGKLISELISGDTPHLNPEAYQL